MLNTVESQGQSVEVFKSAPIHILPDELIDAIFQNLSISALATASQVCKKWHEITYSDILWKLAAIKKLGDRVVDYFESLVEAKKTTWKEVLRVVTPSFLCFLDTVLTDHIPFLRNPSFNPNKDTGQFLVYGSWRFTIVNESSILIKNSTSHAENSFQVEEGQFITHLAHDGHFIFALCKTGHVLQIDYRENKLVNTIETSIRTDHTYFQDEDYTFIKEHATKNEGGFLRDVFVTRNPFFASNGILFISYFMQLMDVIHYQKAHAEMLNSFEFELIDWGLEILLHNHTVYLIGMIDTDKNEVEIHRHFLSNHTNSQPFVLPHKGKNVSAIAMQGQFLYVAQREGWLTVCKIESNDRIKVVDVKKIFGSQLETESIGILEDFLVTFVVGRSSCFIVFLNRHNLQEVARIDTSITENEVFHPALFEKLFELVRGDLTWDLNAIMNISDITQQLASIKRFDFP